MVKKITIQVSDEQIKELGNAIAAYGDLLWKIELGLDISEKYECLRESDIEPVDRLNILKQLHNELTK